MFNTINTIWSAEPPHQTEESDAHHYVERQKPNDHRKQNQNSAKQDDDEQTRLSVEALALFLDKLLKIDEKRPLTGKRYSPDAADFKTQRDFDFIAQLNPESPQARLQAKASAAASLYKKSARLNEPKEKNILLETTDKHSTGPTLDLSTVELRAVIDIRKNLEDLRKHNIRYISLPPAKSFIESLQISVREQLAFINNNIGQTQESI